MPLHLLRSIIGSSLCIVLQTASLGYEMRGLLYQNAGPMQSLLDVLLRPPVYTRTSATTFSWRQNRCCLGDPPILINLRISYLHNLILTILSSLVNCSNNGASRCDSPRALAPPSHIPGHGHCAPLEYRRNCYLTRTSTLPMDTSSRHGILLHLHPLGDDCCCFFYQSAVHEEAWQESSCSALEGP